MHGQQNIKIHNPMSHILSLRFTIPNSVDHCPAIEDTSHTDSNETAYPL